MSIGEVFDSINRFMIEKEEKKKKNGHAETVPIIRYYDRPRHTYNNIQSGKFDLFVR